MNKDQWHAKAIALLANVARKAGIATSARKIRSNKGGNAVGGEVTMSAPEYGVYVSIHCPVNSYGERDTIGGNYARRATAQDPYGCGIDCPNRSFQVADEATILGMMRSIKGGAFANAGTWPRGGGFSI